MKRFLSALLIVVLMVLPASSLAEAISPQHNATLNFFEYLDAAGMSYDFGGTSEDGSDIVTMSITGDKTTIGLYMYFEEDNASIFVWNLISFDALGFMPVMKLCNDLNYYYRWVQFCVDMTDDTVTMSADVAFTDEDAGELVYERVMRMSRIADDCWDKLSAYQK